MICFYQFSVFGGNIYILGEMERRVFRGWVVKRQRLSDSQYRSFWLGCSVMSLKYENKRVVFITVRGPLSAVVSVGRRISELPPKISPINTFLLHEKEVIGVKILYLLSRVTGQLSIIYKEIRPNRMC